MDISALNFRRFDRGATRGLFDIRYGGLVIKGCRLMGNSNGGLWIAMPQRQSWQAGKTEFIDIIELTNAEMEYVRRLVMDDLKSQGHLAKPATRPSKSKPTSSAGKHRTPEGEDLTEHYTDPRAADDIPF